MPDSAKQRWRNMSSENAGSAASSGATSNRPPQQKKKQSELSEADFLANQQAKARAAMDTAIGDMKRALSGAFKDNAHLTEWMGAYPWVSLGLGAAAGFLAGSALTPSREETFKERLRSLMEEVKPKEEKEKAREKGAEKAARAAVEAQKPSFMGQLGQGLFDVVKTALITTLSAAVTAKAVEDNEPKAGNGQGTE
jgi:ElaB/YqjD/DUF883 family membrane-anchored ribosome-binding protein